MERENIDLHIGKRIKLKRNSLGISQAELGKKIDLSFQQIQKYEKGVNKIHASKLYNLGKAMGVEINYFFDGFKKELLISSFQEENTDYLHNDELNSFGSKNHENESFLKIFQEISNPKLRKKIIKLLEIIIKE